MRKPAPKRKAPAKTRKITPVAYSARQSPKKAQWAGVAETQFVEMGLSLAEISRRIPVSQLSLRKWAAAGDWFEKRHRYMDSPQQQQQKITAMLTFLVDEMDKSLRKKRTIVRGDIDSFLKLKKGLEYFRGDTYFNAHLVMVMEYLIQYLQDRNRQDLVKGLTEVLEGFGPWAQSHYQGRR